MICNLEGKFEFKLFWFRDNIEIINGGRYIMLLKKDVLVLDRYVVIFIIKVYVLID